MQSDLLQKFGARVRELRHAAHLSQEELAERVGIHRTYIGGIERGERNICLLNISKIADALEISLSEFFDFSDSGSKDY